MNNIDIVSAVKAGMKKSASVTYLMNFSSGGKINTEYVATVSIGLSLVDSDFFCYDDDKIIFEYPTGKFISATIPILKRLEPNEMFSRSIIRKNANTTRSGRIDIAILDSKSCFDRPRCAIEVKGDNPAKGLLIADIKRNLEYFKHTGPTGTSNLELALNCSFYSYNESSKKTTVLLPTTRKKGLKN